MMEYSRGRAASLKGNTRVGDRTQTHTSPAAEDYHQTSPARQTGRTDRDVEWTSASASASTHTRTRTRSGSAGSPSTLAGTAEPARPAAVHEMKDYSDLEVVEVIPPTWDSTYDKMPVLIDSSEKMAAGAPHDAGRGVNLLSPSVADPVPAYPASVKSSFKYRGSMVSTSPLTGKSGSYFEFDANDAQPVGPRRICGMTNKTLSCVAVGLLAFVLILLGTVLGITLTLRGNATAAAASSSSAAAKSSFGILADTRLSAVNWTDTTGTDRSAVFYQDSSNSIMVALRDSLSNEWTQSNVTRAIMNTTGARRLDVLSGTPLAAVSNRYQVSLYYLTNNNDVAEIWASDVVGNAWFAGNLGSKLGPHAMNGSSLTAFWQVCTNCTGSLCLVYQEDDGQLQLANMTENTWSLAGPVDRGVPSNNATAMSIRPMASRNATGPTGTDPNGLRIFDFDSTGLVQHRFGTETASSWVDETASSQVNAAIATDPRTELAALTYGSHGWTKCIVSYLTVNGSLVSFVYNGNDWESGEPSLKGSSGSTKFGAIATAQNMMVYGFANGSIFEYQVDERNPLSWTLSGTVMSGADSP